MITRGKYIGDIIDSLSQIQTSIEFRSKLGLYDINKYCEDFSCELLNLVYGYRLINLNEERLNSPGLDLGDKTKKSAFQITSDKKKSKIDKTLENITDAQKAEYDEIFIFVLGTKQKSYSIDGDIYKKLNFTKENIIDFNDICSKILYLPIQDVESISKLFRNKTSKLLTEFELPNEDGIYQTSIFNHVEEIRSEKINGIDSFFKYINRGYAYPADEIHNKYKLISDLIRSLKRQPRLTREFIAFIIERGDYENFKGTFQIESSKLSKILNLGDKYILDEINYLSSQNLITSDQEDTEFGTINKISLCGPLTKDYILCEMTEFINENKIPLRSVFVNLDFSSFS